MGAVGNYIHLTLAGYDHRKVRGGKSKDGTYTTPGPYYDGAGPALSKKHAEIIARVNKYKVNADLQSIENMYNRILSFYKLPQDSREEIDKGYKIALDAIEKDTNTEFNRQFIGRTIDYATMAVTAGNEEIQRINKTTFDRHSNRRKTNEVGKNVKTLINKLDQVRSNLASMKIDNNMKNNLEKQYNFILNALEEIPVYIRTKSGYVQQGTYKEALENQIGKTKRALYVVKSDMVGDEAAYKEFWDEFNKLLGMGQSVTGLEIGEAFELFATNAGLQLANFAKEEVEEEIASQIANVTKYGNSAPHNSYSGYGTMYVTGAKYKKNFKKRNNIKTTKDFGDFITTIDIPTQNKVDMTITLKDGEDLNFSLKNYNLNYADAKKNGMITLVSGTPLLSLIQNENDNDFINHYLNISLPHLATKGATTYEMDTYAKAKEYDTVMRELILLKAATGDNVYKWNEDSQTFGTIGTANVFMVNDNSKGRIKIISMQSLLEKVYASKGYTVGLPSYQSWNRKEEHVKTRIAGIVTQLHNTKIHAAVKASAVGF